MTTKQIRTACDVIKDVKRVTYHTPKGLTNDELVDLVDDLTGYCNELHDMAVRMESRLIEYNEFVKQLQKDTVKILE